MLNGVKVRTAGKSFHYLHSQILEVVVDKLQSMSVILEFGTRPWRYVIVDGCRISSQYLSVMRLPIRHIIGSTGTKNSKEVSIAAK